MLGWREQRLRRDLSLIFNTRSGAALDRGSCIVFHQFEALDETINLSKLELSLDLSEGVQRKCNIPYFTFNGGGGGH